MKDIPGFCVVIGANGTGKTTLFDVFGFLQDCLTYNVKQALQRRGNFREVISRGCSEQDNIEIRLQFRMALFGVDRLVTYLVRIGLEQGAPVVRREYLRYKRAAYGSPFHFLDFRNGAGHAVTNEADFDKPETKLDREQQSVEPYVLAIKGLGQFERFKAASAFRRLIENWHVSDFHIQAARGSKDITGDYEHLSATGDNLQRVAYDIYEHKRELFDRIVAAMQHRVPGIHKIKPKATEDGRLILHFQDAAFDKPFMDRHVSDGTLKMFAYLVLLYDPAPHPLLCVEEPENQLYPELLWELAEEFRAYAKRGGQVFVSSHSPDFLNAAALEEVYWLVKEQGDTTIRRAQDDTQLAAWMAEGDQMGHLWRSGEFGKLGLT